MATFILKLCSPAVYPYIFLGIMIDCHSLTAN